MSFNFDPAYLALLKSNRELRKELNSEASINQSNEKKICILIKELEQCNRSISFQDTTIIAHEKEIQELKSQVSDLQKRLRSALKDVDKKESYALDLEQRLSTLEEEAVILKKKIREITSRKYNKLSMSDPIQLQAQIQGDAQIIIQLQAQLDTANNNFDLLNQAHIFQTGQLQTCQTDLQN